MHQPPASTIITLLGGISEVSRIAGVSTVTVQRWRFPQGKGGTGGFIPRKYHEALIKGAADKGIVLSPSAFFEVEPETAQPPQAAE